MLKNCRIFFLFALLILNNAYAADDGEIKELTPKYSAQIPENATPITVIPNTENTVKAKCRFSFTRLAGKTLLAAGVGVFAREASGWIMQKPHIGYGIYLDADTIVDKFLTTEQKIHPRQNALEIAKTLSAKLSGDYDWKIYNSPFLSLSFTLNKDASSYLDPENKARGVCRHKAAVLAGVLNHLGIKASTQFFPAIGSNGKFTFHVVVDLPDLGMVADPTAGQVLSLKEFQDSNHIIGPVISSEWTADKILGAFVH